MSAVFEMQVGRAIQSPPSAAPQLSASLLCNLRSQTQRQRRKALMLVAPLIAFLMAIFILPLAVMFFYAFNNPEVKTALPRSLAVLQSWDGKALPPDAVAQAFAADLLEADRPMIADLARRLNYEIPGYRSALMALSRQLRSRGGEILTMQDLAASDPFWADPASWSAITRSGSSFTPYYMLAAFDLKRGDDGAITKVAPEQRLFLAALGRTVEISVCVTLICLILGLPLANMIATARPVVSALLLGAVLVPFWTSLLVRTSAWIVILQREGLLNQLLQGTGLISEPLQLIFNRGGVYVAMVHILLPFMVLPILSVMKSLPPSYMRASASLGATPFTGFRRVYLPLVLPGIGAGVMLTFILALGYYITPTLVGGAGDQMLSYFIAFYTNTTLNWGMAAAIGLVLLGFVLLLYLLIGRFIGIGRLVGME